MQNVAAILLAAGRSRRMGAFKPLLAFGESTVIESCITNFSGGGVETIVVVLGHRADELRARLKHLPIKFASNPDPDSEMSKSIACGVRALSEETRATLIAPADCPALPSVVIAQLIAEWRNGAGLLIPEFAGRGGHPVLIDLGYRDELLELDAERGLRGLFDRHRDLVQRVPVQSPYIARDLDTWDDYLALHREIFGTTPSQPIPGS